MKVPNVSDREWHAIQGDTLNPDRTWGVVQYLTLKECQEIDGDDAEYPSRTVVLAEVTAGETSASDAKMMAASKSLAACLHRQMERLRTMPNWELITRPTKAEMVEEMRKVLLEAGYTE